MSGGDFAHNAYATEMRTQKAVKLEAYLRTSGLPSWAASPADLTADERRMVERAAGTRPGSEETWAMVQRLWEGA